MPSLARARLSGSTNKEMRDYKRSLKAAFADLELPN